MRLIALQEYLFELRIKGSLRYKVNKRFRDFDSLHYVVRYKATITP